MDSDKCPFRVGDRVRFVPTERTRGQYPFIEELGLRIGEVKTVSEIRNGIYLYFDNETGGWPWPEFLLATSSLCPFSPGDQVKFFPDPRTIAQFDNIYTFMQMKAHATYNISDVRGDYILLQESPIEWRWTQFVLER